MCRSLVILYAAIIVQNCNIFNTIYYTNTNNKLKNCRKNGAPEDLYEGLDSNGLYDFTEEVKIYLSTVDILNGEHTTSLYIWFLRGSKNSKLPRKYQEHPCHGFGKHKSERWWKAFGN